MVGANSKLVGAAGLLIATLSLSLAPAFAQGAAPAKPEAKPEMMANCPGLIAARSPLLTPASFRPSQYQVAALAADQVRLNYIGHSTFLIESPQLVRIATDYNDYVRPTLLPDIATMNHAHSTHYTDRPDPGIKYVLRGWADNEKPARIDLTYKDVRVRNVPTNIRTWGGDTERHGNSIFIFEIANLCIAHLGHLHHADTGAAQRDRPHRRGHGAGRRQHDARSRRHDGSATRTQSTVDDPDALFQRLYARSFFAAGASGVGRRDRRSTFGSDIQSEPTG